MTIQVSPRLPRVHAAPAPRVPATVSECQLRLLASPVAGDHLALLVAVGGDADADGLATVSGRLRMLADSGHDLCLDLTGVAWADPALTLLLPRLIDIASAHGRDVRVVAASPAAARALALAVRR